MMEWAAHPTNGGVILSNSDRDNHANQMNPNNDAYWQTRGYDERPEDWREAEKDEVQHQYTAATKEP